MEAVERAGIGHKARPLRPEHLPDGLVAYLRMRLRLGPGDAAVDEPGVQLVIARHTRTRGEKKRCRTVPTWFSTWPFSQPEAGVHAPGSTR